MSTYQADVTIVGYGAVARLLAAILGQKGHSVVVLEKEEHATTSSRAVCVDEHARRAMYACGFGAALAQCGTSLSRWQWLGEDGSVMQECGATAGFAYRPVLDRAMDARIAGLGTVDVRFGHEVLSLDQDAGGTQVRFLNHRTGARETLYAKYLIAADGARSLVRELTGIGAESRRGGYVSLVAEWFDEADAIDLSSATIRRTPVPVLMTPGGVRDGRPVRRYEFLGTNMASLARFDSAETMASLLPSGAAGRTGFLHHEANDAVPMLARRWQEQRIFLAGSAAYRLPPLLGRGNCEAVRDALNLAWRLDLVLTGLADEECLRQYAVERRQQVEDSIDDASRIAAALLAGSSSRAQKQAQAERLARLLNGSPLAEGTLFRGAGMEDTVGSEAPHWQQGSIGMGFTLIVRSEEIAASIPRWRRAFLRNIGAHVWCPVDGDGFASYLDRHDLCALIVRPDFYIFAAVEAAAQLGPAIESLSDALGYQDQPTTRSALQVAH